MKTNLFALLSGLMLLLFSCKSLEKSAKVSDEISNKPNVERIETILYVSPRFGDCHDGSEGKCLYVRQFANEEWIAIREISENFDYRPGFEHRIKVHMNSDYTDINYVETLTLKNPLRKEGITDLNDVWSLFLMKDQKMELSKEDAPTLIFNTEAHSLTGKSFCTELVGMFNAENPNHIEIQAEGIAALECNQELENFEGYLLHCLSSANAFRIENEILYLYIGEDMLLGFKKLY